MNKRQFLSAAAASLLALGGVSAALPAHVDTLGKCFGVAQAGHNDCAGLSRLHSCKGQSTMSSNPGDFAAKPTGTCAEFDARRPDVGFDTRCIALDAAAARWIGALRDALARIGDDVDVAAWLGDAVRAGWIDGIVAVTMKETLA